MGNAGPSAERHAASFHAGSHTVFGTTCQHHGVGPLLKGMDSKGPSFYGETMTELTPTELAILSEVGNFSWNLDKEFFVQTSMGNFVWKDPALGGDNTFTKFEGSFAEYCIKQGGTGFFCPSKGHRQIIKFCGRQIKIVGFEVPCGTRATQDIDSF